MEQEKIKKVNTPYLLACIFLPILAIVLASVLSITLLPSGAGSIIITLFLFASIIWWSIGIKKVHDKKKEEKLKELDSKGFVRNHTFNSDNCTVAVDVEHGKIALTFKWNPTQCYVMPANKIAKMWVDDGKTPLGGTSRVSFLFIVDGIKVRVNTFISNKTWSMKSNNVLEAISKADMMVETLRMAAQTACNIQ